MYCNLNCCETNELKYLHLNTDHFFQKLLFNSLINLANFKNDFYTQVKFSFIHSFILPPMRLDFESWKAMLYMLLEFIVGSYPHSKEFFLQVQTSFPLSYSSHTDTSKFQFNP